MQIMDIILVLFVLYCFIRGMFNGFIKEFFSTFFLIIAIVITKFIIQIFNFGNLSNIKLIVVYCITFILIYVVLTIVLEFLNKFTNLTLINSLNRFLGAIFGLLKGLILLAIILEMVFLLSFKVTSLNKYIKNSYIFNTREIVLENLQTFFPKNILEEIKKIDRNLQSKKMMEKVIKLVEK